MYVQISPPGAQSLRQQGGWDWLSRPSVLSPTNDIEISDARVHEEGAGGRQYVVCLYKLADQKKKKMKKIQNLRFREREHCAHDRDCWSQDSDQELAEHQQ